ncbi:MAG: adenylosuccinate lyase [Bacteroidaceae bacterium]|nr:adenylosuccinate lyase [Bacteroidaceae bacterium]
MNALQALCAVSPVDGRYASKTECLSPYFSECALIRYRVRVEVEYFIWLSTLGLRQFPALTPQQVEALRNIYIGMTADDALSVKKTEAVTNHDVKAVEYYVKERAAAIDGLAPYMEFIHFGLTSQDINNTSFPLMVKDALEGAYLPALRSVIDRLNAMAAEWGSIPMLARTHGQPASPTTLGKEIKVFAYRLEKQVETLAATPISAKFGGATGNLNAHCVAFPDRQWDMLATEFVEGVLGLTREAYTTQISNYDNLAALFDAMRRVNTVLIDLCRDVWQYISMDYFKQRIKAGEVGSSAMPHKVNPIDFENAEGNLGMADAVLAFLAQKLPISRLQRDLTDSTVLRNVGVPFAHVMIALNSLEKGIGKLVLNEGKLHEDLRHSWAVVAEAVQTILRREGYPKPYETLKQLTRTGGEITQETIAAFINDLNVGDDVKDELRAITPYNYIGVGLRTE